MKEKIVYLKDWEYLRPRATKVSYLQAFEDTTQNFARKPPIFAASKEITSSSILKQYIFKYCEISSLHGISYLTHPEFKLYEKIIWFLILIATSLACIFVYIDLAELYYTQRVQTTVADSVSPIFMIPFPSIGLCLPYRIDWHRLQNEAAPRFLPANVSREKLYTFYEFFDEIGDIKFSSLMELSPMFERNSPLNLSLIDDIDILEVIRFLTPTCTEVFEGACLWRKRPYNCCDLFSLERTETGFCYIFNSAINQKDNDRAQSDPYYPYHNSNTGEGSGLEVRMVINEEKISPMFDGFLGIYVMIKQPEQWHSDVKFVNYNTFTKLGIGAQLTETNNRTRSIPPLDRACIFEDEVNHHLYKKIPGLRYWRGNCRTRCHQEYLLKRCNCNLNLLFPITKTDNFTICKPSDFKCIYDNAFLFSREHHVYESLYIEGIGNDSMTCNCMNNCNQLLYDAFFNSAPLEGVNSTDTLKYVHMDIHFQKQFFIRYRTSMRYTFVELLANFGGIIGLFLGASLLSAVELFYYFTIGMYARLQKPFEAKCKEKKQDRKKHRHYQKSKLINNNRFKY
ncbi:pickpocket 21 [Haematobia irritans]|uniref:pickpocket 21 n=1 Tax=Haematobia irritans TaxID=7368 RepID=UPI003F503705